MADGDISKAENDIAYKIAKTIYSKSTELRSESAVFSADLQKGRRVVHANLRLG